MGEPKKFTVFISRVSREFMEPGDAIKVQFEAHGAKVHMQTKDVWNVSDGPEIMRQIDASDLVICLIGLKYGGALPPNNLPPAAKAGDSWTQWEYRYALAKRKPLIAYVIRPPENDDESTGSYDKPQLTFIREMRSREHRKFGDPFYQPVKNGEEIVESIKRMLVDENSTVGKMRDAFWRGVKTAYRAADTLAWRKTHPSAYRDDRQGFFDPGMMNHGSPPFIESQGFMILKPDKDGCQKRHLHPNAFIAGRDSEARARAREGAHWLSLTGEPDQQKGPEGGLPLSRQKLAAALSQPPGIRVTLGGLELPNPIRIYLISGGGVGKSTNMRWVAAALNGLSDTAEATPSASEESFAVLVTAQDFKNKKVEDVEKHLRDRICARARIETDAWHAESVLLGVKKDIRAGRVILLIDGLDHVDSSGVRLLTDIQEEGANERWGKCKIVVAGRPHALTNWRDRPEHGNQFVVAENWRFVEPIEFTEAEAEAYLGNADGEARYGFVHDKLGRLIQVPRVLEYTRTLNRDALQNLRTAADVYEKAIRHLVVKTIEQGGALLRPFGAPVGYETGEGPLAPQQIDYILRFLSALAFMSLCQTTEAARPLMGEPLGLDDDHIRELETRVRREPASEYSGSHTIKQDLEYLKRFAAIVTNGFIEEVGQPGSQPTLNFCNRSVEQFLAAYWLAKHAPEEDVQRMRQHIYFPVADFAVTDDKCPDWLRRDGAPAILRTDITYEFNLYLAEMPRSSVTPTKWIEAAKYWFDPDLFSGASRAIRLWPTEMMFRAWARMSEIASGRIHDWWDIPYDAIASSPPGPRRGNRSPHASIATNPPTENAIKAARAVLEKFRNEFSAILEGKQNGERQTVARAMIAGEEWVSVPGGSFSMGRPESLPHGCPTQKVENYWKDLLHKVQNGDITAEAAADEATWSEWFSGAQGDRIRDYDVKWLRDEVFQPLHIATEAAGGDKDKQKEALEKALQAIHVRWHTTDETPAETLQAVAAFEMHRYPMLFKWYWLFAPGHRFIVEEHLKDLGKRRKIDSHRLPDKLVHPPCDHPVTYVSWFDAWAFCQWASWPASDPRGSEPSSAKLGRWHLRLPHEPEWEYAARGRKGASGEIEFVPRENDWWWGNAFYESDGPTEERLSRDQAHADGRPAMTRAPAKAKPNGLGFYDILGNVWEWMANPYDLRGEDELKTLCDYSIHYSRFAPQKRPRVMVLRAIRGGLWYFLNILATCTNRWRLLPDDYEYKRGFRVVREWYGK
jgi:formylglycine-generating enzyme required for sulfatase activity